jgi:hypothetical protein
MKLTKILAGAAIGGALGFSALGLTAGVANADPSSHVVAETLWAQDRGGHGRWGHDDHRDWGYRGDYDYGYGGYGPRWGCISGPLGHLTWCP